MKEFDVSEYEEHELKVARKILGGLLKTLEAARLDTLRKNDKLTPNEAFQLALELKAYDYILETIDEELGLRQRDMLDEELDTEDQGS